MWRIEPSRSKPRRAVIFSRPGQSSCLSITQDCILRDDPADHRRRHHNHKRERVVLQNERNVRADRLCRLTIVSHDLVVGPQGIRRTDHDARGAEFHHLTGERPHGRKARSRHADDDGHACTLDDAFCNRDQLVVVELGRFAQLTEDRDAIDSAFQEKVGHAIQRRFINPAIVMERSRCDRDDCLIPLVRTKISLLLI